MIRSNRENIRPARILKALRYFLLFALLCATPVSGFSVEISQQALGIASSAGKAEACGFSEQTGRDAFENVGLLVGCSVASGELTDAQADKLLLEAAKLYHASRDEQIAPPKEVCVDMRYLMETFAKVQGC